MLPILIFIDVHGNIRAYCTMLDNCDTLWAFILICWDSVESRDLISQAAR